MIFCPAPFLFSSPRAKTTAPRSLPVSHRAERCLHQSPFGAWWTRCARRPPGPPQHISPRRVFARPESTNATAMSSAREHWPTRLAEWLKILKRGPPAETPAKEAVRLTTKAMRGA
jgi:hypothetical protein